MRPNLARTLLSWWDGLRAGLSSSAPSGVVAELRAAVWLERELGMRVVARNWRNPHDRREEIDLVLRDGPVLVFVEVKGRAAHARVPGVNAVGSAKRSILRRAVKAYLAGLRGPPRPFRFDVIEVEVDSGIAGDSWRVRHFPGIPLFAADLRR